MSRFKTELCNNLIELGTCKYGDRCHYAHGNHELRQVSKRHPKYRTEKCKNFELTGKCPFGPRCSYVHPKPDLDLMIEQLTKYLKHTRAPKPEVTDSSSTTNNTTHVSSQASVHAALNSSKTHAHISSSIATCRTPLSTNSNANILTPVNANQQQPRFAYNNLLFKPTQATTNENQHPSLSSSSSSVYDEFLNLESNHKKLPLISNNENPNPQPATSNNLLLSSNNPFGINNPLSDFLNKSNFNSISNVSELTPNKNFYTRF